MAWEIEFTDEFEVWWFGLTAEEQASVDYTVNLLEQKGTSLPYPHSSQIQNSKHSLRELRIQHGGKPYRVFYAFDPRRMAILLIGGNKTGDDRFYERMVPLADRIYDEHLEEINHGKKIR